MTNLYKNDKEKELDNGFIYPFLNKLMDILIIINLVEAFKLLAEYFAKQKYKKSDTDTLNIKVRKTKNFAIDLFIIGKFVFVLILWKYNISNIFTTILVLYLLFMNIITYFYYHIWNESAILNNYLTINRVRRRFTNLFLSFLFMIIGYGYLYNCVYNYCFKADEGLNSINYFLFSISNSFSSSYDKIKTINNIGDFLKLSQVVTTFLFVAIILACSMPRADKE